jgi:hypothetical protein
MHRSGYGLIQLCGKVDKPAMIMGLQLWDGK